MKNIYEIAGVKLNYEILQDLPKAVKKKLEEREKRLKEVNEEQKTLSRQCRALRSVLSGEEAQPATGRPAQTQNKKDHAGSLNHQAVHAWC